MRNLIRLPGRTSYLFLLFLALSLVRGILYASVIPPWQAPDEIAHFEYISLLYQKRHLLQPDDASPLLQQEIISSLYEHRFWSHIPYPEPETMPLSLAEIPFVGGSSVLGRFSLAYPLGALFFGSVFYQDIITQLYAMRLLSVGLGMLVVATAFLTVRELFPNDKFLLLTVPAWISFSPQHTYITSSVSDGNLAELLISILTYIMVVALRRGLSLPRMVIALLLVTLGLWTKATAAFALPWLAIGGLFFLRGRKGETGKKRPIPWVALALTLAVLCLTIWSARNLQSLQGWWVAAQAWSVAQPDSSASIQALRLHAITVFKSFWAYFGWMIAPLDPHWYALLGLLSLAALGGVVAFLVKATRRARPVSFWQRRAVLLLLVGSLLSIIMVLATFGAHYSQGRYLYPAIVAFSTLFMLGIRQLIPSGYEKHLLPLIVCSFFLFDTLCLMDYLLPFFYGGR